MNASEKSRRKSKEIGNKNDEEKRKKNKDIKITNGYKKNKLRLFTNPNDKYSPITEEHVYEVKYNINKIH